MKTTRCVIATIMVIFLMCLDLLTNTSIHAKTVDGLLTFNFEKTTVADALQQITRVTGIRIHINKPFYKAIVGKSFLETDLEYILRDLFRQESVAIEWLYGQRGLDTVFITIYENQKDQGPAPPSTRAIDYGSNVAGNIPVPLPSVDQTSVLGNITKSQENSNVSESSNATAPTSAPRVNHSRRPLPPATPGNRDFVSSPAPPVKHNPVPPPPGIPPGLLSR
jgi:hypothetical protein